MFTRLHHTNLYLIILFTSNYYVEVCAAGLLCSNQRNIDNFFGGCPTPVVDCQVVTLRAFAVAEFQLAKGLVLCYHQTYVRGLVAREIYTSLHLASMSVSFNFYIPHERSRPGGLLQPQG